MNEPTPQQLEELFGIHANRVNAICDVMQASSVDPTKENAMAMIDLGVRILARFGILEDPEMEFMVRVAIDACIDECKRGER